jgi:hypothetical protein
MVEPRGYIGLIDENGDAIDTASRTIQIWGAKTPDEITDTTDTLPIPSEYELGFIKGCAYEYLQTHGVTNKDYSDEYKAAIEGCTARQVKLSQQPMIILPYDMRQD